MGRYLLFLTQDEVFKYILCLIIIFASILYFYQIFRRSKKRNTSILKMLRSDFKKHSFLFVLSVPLITFFVLSNFQLSQSMETFLKTLCYSVVGVGIFSATLKYINSLIFVKKQFEEIVESKKFNKILNKKFKAFVFSDEFLNSISQEELSRKWRKLTYFKYESRFPLLWEKLTLKNVVANYYFKDDTLEYYYDSFRIQINIELLENDLLKITEITDFTLVSNKTDKVNLKFWLGSIEEDNNEVYAKIDRERTIVNGKKISEHVINEGPPVELENNLYNHEKEIIIPLEGKNEYHIDRVIIMTQKYELDRLYSFTTSKIIDDLYIHIQFCDKLNVFFQGLNKIPFSNDNQILEGLSFRNKEIIMPGQIFNVFIDKKQ